MRTSHANAAAHDASRHSNLTLCLLALAITFTAAVTATTRAATINVPAGGNLQAALDAAQPGDEVVLEAGAAFVGNFVLPVKSGASYITVRSSRAGELPAGRRVSPADAPLMARIATPNSAPAFFAPINSHHWRLVGLEVTQSGSFFTYDLVVLGEGDSTGPQDTLAEVPHHLIVERCYLHAFGASTPLKRGVALNSAHTDILDSYIAGVKVVGQDTQAVGGWNGPGPFRVENNFLEATGENVMFGGATPLIPGLVPSDIVIRRNHLYKPLSWRVGDPSYAGTPWTVKNLLELKSARRVLIEGNVMENNWAHAQSGWAVIFNVFGDDTSPDRVEDVEFVSNIIRNSDNGINLRGQDNERTQTGMRRVRVANNLLQNLQAFGGEGKVFQLLQSSESVSFDHNTVTNAGSSLLIFETWGSFKHVGCAFTNNIAPNGANGVIGTGRQGSNALNEYCGVGSWTFARNLVAADNPQWYFFPPDNYVPPAADFDDQFVNFAGGNYRLATTSCGSAASGCNPKGATDGKDVGADIDALLAATAGSISGVWSSPQTPFGGTAPAMPGSFEAENFDNGGEGVAYHDLDAGNNGGAYRATDVDIHAKSAASNGLLVFNAHAGEWLEYTVNVPAAGYYEVGAYSASRLAGGTYHIEIDGVNVTGTLTAPTTGSWWVFQPASKSGVFVAAGTHVVRLALETNGAEIITADFDRLFFNPSAPPQTPFLGTPFALPGTITAKDFDNGGEGVAYHDLTPGNTSWSNYRTSDVDMYDTFATSLQAGEWVEYTVNVAATANTYAVVAQVGSDSTGGALHIEFDGQDVTGPMQVPYTTLWLPYATVTKTGVSLTAGQHVMRVAVDGYFGGLYSIRVVNTAAAQTPLGGTPLPIPGVIPASDFDNGGEMVAYHDNTAGNLSNSNYRVSDVDMYDRIVNKTSAGEWLEYTVNVTSAGTYNLTAEVASESGGGTFHVELDGVDVTGPLTFPNTGSWISFQAVTKSGINLTSGQKVMRLVVDSANNPGNSDLGSFNNIRLERVL